MNASNITSMNSLGLEQPGGKFHMGSTPLGATKNRHFCAAPESLEVLFVPKNYHLIRRGHNLLRFLVQKANYSLSQQSGKTSQEKKTNNKSTQSNFSVRFKALEVQSHLVPSTFPWFDECRAYPATSPCLPFQSHGDQRKSPRRKRRLESKPKMPGNAQQGQQ